MTANMPRVSIVDIAPGVTGCHIPSDRFKTTRITLQFLLPLSVDSVSRNALLPYILSRACRQYPTMTALNSRLAAIYGASLSAGCAKIGDVQSLTISISTLDGKFTFDNSDTLSECANLLRDLVFDPLLDGARFDADLFESEKRLMLERIDGEINDKRKFALDRAVNIMCDGEPYGTPKYGTRTMTACLTAGDIFTAWRDALETAHVRINVIGASCGKIFDQFGKAFSSLSRNVDPGLGAQQIVKAGIGKNITERMAVTQGKLVMGLRSDVTAKDELYVPTVVFCDLFGGSPHSKLFQNVRERLSLCYYCAARYNRAKGIIMVDSGITEANAELARDEIMRQLAATQEGNIEADELEASKIGIINSALTVLDSPMSLDAWYAERALDPNPLSPEELADKVSRITKEDVISAANRFELDTTYLLAPEGESQ